MKSGTSRRAEQAALLRSPHGRRVRSVVAVIGALTAAGLGLAPDAAADTQSRQWYLGPMQAEKMWKAGTGAGIKVAVIGSGVNPDTPSLRGRVIQGVDALAKDGLTKGSVTQTDDTTGQGTTAAELIAGSGKDGGLKGLAPGAEIIPIRVPALKYDELPDPNYPLATAVRAAVDSGAKIIEFAIGNQYPIGTQIVGDEAFDYAAKKGVLMVAGAGDNRKEGNKTQYPAAYPHVVGVAASDKNWEVSSTSQYGDYVDLAAPGEDVPRWCDARFQRYCADGGGTVAASALVSASAALVWSAHPDWTANQVLGSLIDTAGRSWPRNDPSKYGGYGAVRPRMVLENTGYKAGPADVDPLAAENGESPEPSATGSASASATSQAPRKPTTGGTSAAGSSAKPPGDSDTLWIALGTAAAVVVLGGGALAVVRARRAR